MHLHTIARAFFFFFFSFFLLPFRSLDSLDAFKRLESLIADSNQLTSNQPFLPRIPTLTTLCVNDNDIADVEQWLTFISDAFPNLTYLSMLKNPACPNYFIGKDQQDYARYRLYVLHRIPGLKFLDSSPVTAQERAEAKRVGHLMRVARPSSQQVRIDFFLFLSCSFCVLHSLVVSRHAKQESCICD